MPVHGLNVWSLVHHDSLVITRSALDTLERRLLSAQRRVVAKGNGARSRGLWSGRPPMVDDWLVARDHGEDGTHVPERHFAEPLGDVDDLRQRLQ